MTRICGRPGTCPRVRGSHRATDLIAGYGFTSAPGPAGVSVCCRLRPSLGLSSPHGAGSVPWHSMVTGTPATVLCLAGGCAARLAALGAIG